MNRIQELRKAAGLKQSDLAARLSVARTTISNYELGYHSMAPEVIQRLCEFFGVTSDYLLGLSSVPKAAVSEHDAALIAAYYAAPDNIQGAINTMLQPYFEQVTSSASQSDREGDRHGAV